MSLFNIFNPLGQVGDLLKDLIELVIKNGTKLILVNTVIEIYRCVLVSFVAASGFC